MLTHSRSLGAGLGAGLGERWRLSPHLRVSAKTSANCFKWTFPSERASNSNLIHDGETFPGASLFEVSTY